MKILLLENNQINRKKYDHIIEQSPFGTVYALSWYLDVVAPNWKLLATEEYDYVMPLPVKRKYGVFPYLIQPPLCQQLGLFSGKRIDPEIIDCFLKEIRYPYVLFQLNAGNAFPVKNFKLRPNYLLYLDKPYEELYKAYKSNARRELKNIAKFDLQYEKDLDANEYLDLIRENSKYYSESLLPFLKILIREASVRNMAILHSVRKKDTGKIVAAVLFIRFKNRYYYLAPVSTSTGKLYRAMRFLLDSFIMENANTPYILDFEGSTIASVAQFYESFGSIFETYPRYFVNYLPFVSKIKI